MAGTAVSQVTIVMGADIQFAVRVVSNPSGDPFSLTGVTDIHAIFQNDPALAQAPIEVTMGQNQVTPDATIQGKVNITLTQAQTAQLLAGDSQSFELLLIFGSTRYIVEFVGALNVVARLFPGVS